jgi:hypothetical protein
LLVRLDVLGVEPGVQGAAGRVRLRATYEKSRSNSESDAYDPQIDSIDQRFNRLEGRSIEFTIEPGGGMTDFKGLDEFFSSQAEADPILSWAKELSSSSEFPREGIAVGQKWSNERPLIGTALAGLTWRAESTYLRDEPCRASGGDQSAAQPSRAPEEMCAIILTRSEISHRGSPHSDATPDDYRRNGLRTSGKLTGSGESIESISLASGMLVGSTQHSVQDMDYEIVSASTGSRIHHTGHVIADTEIKLLLPSARQP